MYYLKIQIGKPTQPLGVATFYSAIQDGNRDIYYENVYDCRELMTFDLATIFEGLKRYEPPFEIFLGINGKGIIQQDVRETFSHLFYEYSIENNRIVFRKYIPSLYRISLALLLWDDHYSFLEESPKTITSEILNSEDPRWDGITEAKILTAFYWFRIVTGRAPTIESFYNYIETYESKSGPATAMRGKLIDIAWQLEDFYFLHKEEIDKLLSFFNTPVRTLIRGTNLSQAERRTLFDEYE